MPATRLNAWGASWPMLGAAGLSGGAIQQGAAPVKAPAAGADPVQVYAAGSLRDALTEIARDHEARTGQKVVLTFGASGLLRGRIEQGASAQVFASADTDHPQRLAARGGWQAPVVFTRNALCALTSEQISATPETLLATMNEVGESVYRAGFRKLLIVNGHGGQPQVGLCRLRLQKPRWAPTGGRPAQQRFHLAQVAFELRKPGRCTGGILLQHEGMHRLQAGRKMGRGANVGVDGARHQSASSSSSAAGSMRSPANTCRRAVSASAKSTRPACSSSRAW